MIRGRSYRSHKNLVLGLSTLQALREGRTVGYAVPSPEAGEAVKRLLRSLGADDVLLCGLTIIDVSAPPPQDAQNELRRDIIHRMMDDFGP